MPIPPIPRATIPHLKYIHFSAARRAATLDPRGLRRMSLGTKILVLTLALTLGLSGAVLWTVTAGITAQETRRAQAAVGQTIRLVTDRIESRHRQIQREVQLVLQEPGYRAELERLGYAADPDDEEARFALNQLRSYVFGVTIQTILSADGVPPAFHVLLNDEGDALLAHATVDDALNDPLIADVKWPFQAVVAHEPLDRQRRYVWLRGGLYLAFGVPLSVGIEPPSEGDGPRPPASHAYFCGDRVDDAWLDAMLGAQDEEGAAPLAAWYLIDGAVAARGGTLRQTDVAAINSALFENAADPTAAAAQPIAFTIHDERFLGRATRFAPAAGVRAVFVVASSLDAALAPLRRMQRILAAVSLAVILLALIVCRRVARMIAEPVRQIAAGTQRIARGDFGERLDTARRDELGALARSFNQMAAGLAQRELIKETFGKFVDPRIVEGLLADPTRLRPGGDIRVQTVMFTDLAGFSAVAERMGPEDLVRLLNRHLGDAADVIAETRGIVDKFIGDAVVAFWGPPLTDAHAEAACRAALRCVARTAGLADLCRALGCPPLRMRVGLATGDVLVGNIGSPSKYNYTVMGDTANLGARLEGLNKLYSACILAAQRTVREAGDAIIWRTIDTVRVVGRAEPVVVCEVLAEADSRAPTAFGSAGDIMDGAMQGANRGATYGRSTVAAASNEGAALKRRCDAYAAALRLYESRDWLAARDAFAAVCGEFPDDAPARVMADRCAALLRDPPPPDWDGVWEVGTK